MECLKRETICTSIEELCDRHAKRRSFRHCYPLELQLLHVVVVAFLDDIKSFFNANDVIFSGYFHLFFLLTVFLSHKIMMYVSALDIFALHNLLIYKDILGNCFMFFHHLFLTIPFIFGFGVLLLGGGGVGGEGKDLFLAVSER